MLLLSLAERRPLFAPPPPPVTTETDARRTHRAFALSRGLAAAHDLAAAERIAAAAVAELTAADRAACLFHDAGDGSLWSEERLRGAAGDERRAVGGLAGFAARTGLPLAAAHLADDPRGLPAIDDPDGDFAEHVLVHPVVGGNGQVHAVLVAAREPARPMFDGAEIALLASFAALIAPFLDQMSAQIETQTLLEVPQDQRLFRQEAIEAQALPRWGDVIRVTPAWIGWTYWLLVATLAASLVYVALGTVATYSTGPAVVRSTSRKDVLAAAAGNVTAVRVAPGNRVAPGDVLVRLDDSEARGLVEETRREFETQLRKHMLEPGRLQQLRLELEKYRRALADRVVRATASGVITEVRVNEGGHLERGDVVAAISEGAGELELAALLPGSDRPQLAPGMELRLELAGYRYAYQTLVIDSVSEDASSPREALRTLGLGPEMADAMGLSGPVVVVHARIPGFAFERILHALVPGLRRF
jgi:hypothetical protein